MNKYEIEFSKEARKDLKDIVRYIKYNLQEPNIALKFANKIKNNIEKLSENPNIYSIIDDKFLKKFELRKMIVDNYIIFYKIDDKQNKVQIVRIMYGRRNWIKLL